jgi:hypothetical protein
VSSYLEQTESPVETIYDCQGSLAWMMCCSAASRIASAK